MIFKLFFLLLLPCLLLSGPINIQNLISINDENFRLSKNCDLSALEHVNRFSFSNGKIIFNTTALPTFESIFLEVFNFYNDDLPKTSYLDMNPVLKKYTKLNATILNEQMGSWQTALTTVNGILKRCDKKINSDVFFFWKLWKLEEILVKPKITEFSSFSFDYEFNATLQQQPHDKFLNVLRLVMNDFQFLLNITLLPSSEKYLEFKGVSHQETPIGPQGYTIWFENYAKKFELYFVEFSIKMKLNGTLFMYITDERGRIKRNFKWEKIDTKDAFDVINIKLDNQRFVLGNGYSFLFDYEGIGAFMLREGEVEKMNDLIMMKKIYVNRDDVKNWKNTGKDMVGTKQSVAVNLTMEIFK